MYKKVMSDNLAKTQLEQAGIKRDQRVNDVFNKIAQEQDKIALEREKDICLRLINYWHKNGDLSLQVKELLELIIKREKNIFDQQILSTWYLDKKISGRIAEALAFSIERLERIIQKIKHSEIEQRQNSYKGSRQAGLNIELDKDINYQRINELFPLKRWWQWLSNLFSRN